MAGGAAGVGTALITNAGLVAPPSPGSIFAYFAVTPRGGYVSMLATIVIAAGVSFAVAAALLGFGRERRPAEAVPEPVAVPVPSGEPAGPVLSGRDVTSVVVACDAGMGSSVMLASQLGKRLKPYGVTVEHRSISEIPSDARLVLTHADLAVRARGVVPRAVVVEFRSFLGDPVFDEVEAAIRDGGELRG